MQDALYAVYSNFSIFSSLYNDGHSIIPATIYGNDENKLKLIIINELPTSDKAAYSYMQPEYVEIKSVIDDINKMIVGVHVYYMDGSEDSDYYRVESISKSDISRIQIYRL